MPHSKGGTYRGKGGKFTTGVAAHKATTKKKKKSNPGIKKKTVVY